MGEEHGPKTGRNAIADVEVLVERNKRTKHINILHKCNLGNMRGWGWVWGGNIDLGKAQVLNLFLRLYCSQIIVLKIFLCFIFPRSIQ